jgi:putative DNA primase/helicase
MPSVLVLQTIGFTGVQQVDPPPRREGDEEHSGQLRMAYRLAKSHNNKLLYVHGIGWHYYDGKRWAVDKRGGRKPPCGKCCAARSPNRPPTNRCART